MWDAVNGAQVCNVVSAHVRGVHSLSWSPDSKRVASAGGWDPYVRIWEAASGARVESFTDYRDLVEGVLSVRFAPAGGKIASGSRDNCVRVWDAQNGALLLTLAEHSRWVTCLAYSHDGGLLASGGADCTVQVWDTESGGLIRTVQLPAEVRCVAFGRHAVMPQPSCFSAKMYGG